MDDVAPTPPKSIPLKERAWHVVLAVLRLIYGAYGLQHDDLYIPGKRSRGVHLHGTAAWIMYGAFVCASLNLLAVAVDHCSTGESERGYRMWARATQVTGWSLFAAALLFGLFYRESPHW
jgi:hypothetical protein